MLSENCITYSIHLLLYLIYCAKSRLCWNIAWGLASPLVLGRQKWSCLNSLSICCTNSFPLPFNITHKSGSERASSLLAMCYQEVWSLLVLHWFIWNMTQVGGFFEALWLCRICWQSVSHWWELLAHPCAGKPNNNYSCCCYYMVGLMQYTLQWGWLWRSQGSCGPEGSDLCAKWCLLLKATAVLWALHWLPKVFWLESKVLVLTYNAFYGLTFCQLLDCIRLQELDQPVRPC